MTKLPEDLLEKEKGIYVQIKLFLGVNGRFVKKQIQWNTIICKFVITQLLI